MNFKALLNPDEVDLNRDGLMEASAGTGKTYTIEKLVCRLVVEKEVPIGNILVVTYTEKAAGEMSHRIREAIRMAARENPANTHLQTAMTDFDTAQISTIHSFCYRLIREFAFEMALPWSLSMVDDNDMLESHIHDRMRRHWAASTTLGEYYSQEPEKDVKTLRETVLNAARLYSPGGGDQLNPPPNQADDLAGFLANETAGVESDCQAGKRVNGQVSYKDMLVLLADALDGGSSLMLEAVRERYSHAFVDEFQDTDPVQWKIFRTAFLESAKHRLFLVGDPKQAIYAFRGGDVHTYITARQELADHGGKLYTLATNWRSVSEIVEAFNLLFTGDDWFPAAEGISCHPAQTPDEPRNRIVSDKTGRKSVTMVQLEDGKVDQARVGYARAIAREIVLLTRTNAFVHENSKRQMPLNFGDIAVLVDKRIDARFLERAFREAGIPSTFYKKQGIYLSDEARQVWALLLGLADANEANGFRKALLSSLIDCPPGAIVHCLDWDASNPRRQLYIHWKSLAEERNWPGFFRSLQEDSGLLVRLASVPGNERPLTNYRQILEDLELHATRRKMSLVELADYLTGLRRETEELEVDQTIHRMETEDPKVQIMTIHTAKGLEFPVVFVFAGLSAKANRSIHRYHSGDSGYVIDFQADESAKALGIQDVYREWRRLYYVAVTRAIYKIYLPLFKGRSKGPLSFLLKTPLDRLAGSDLANTIEAPMTGEIPSVQQVPGAPIQRGAQQPTLPEVTIPSFRHRARFKTSFSRIKGSIDMAGQPFGAPEVGMESEETEKALDENSPPEEITSPSLLPRGVQTGNVLHHVFENIDFGEYSKHSNWESSLAVPMVREAITAAMARFGLSEPDGEAPGKGPVSREIARIVYTTLTVDLPGLDRDTFKLAAVADRVAEVDFTMALPHVGAGVDMSGFVDLVFRTVDPKGVPRYHILDWKSNSLQRYDRKALHHAMTEAGYDLQCRIYQLALDRWLADRLGSRYRREAHLGGAYYLFLRGMREGTTDGIWHAPPPSESELKAIDKELVGLLTRRTG
ncbi:MAG: UvrD-helicase domain-containing protein [Candidatus Sumerlaeia bacterium]|nr:UvrD-helicase domain-containing protein [Candidatus Sumerlaeia bacterium]